MLGTPAGAPMLNCLRRTKRRLKMVSLDQYYDGAELLDYSCSKRYKTAFPFTVLFLVKPKFRRTSKDITQRFKTKEDALSFIEKNGKALETTHYLN